MSDNNKRKTEKELDDFWDLSNLVPQKKSHNVSRKSVEAVEIEITVDNNIVKLVDHSDDDLKLNFTDTTISRTVTFDRNDDDKNSFVSCEQYEMQESPIKKVTLNKYRTAYHFYDEFVNDARRYFSAIGEKCEFVSFFSYMPQYDQLSERQLKYYLWWRENVRRGEKIDIDYSYVLLYIFELINLGAYADIMESQRMLTEIWNLYHDQFPALSSKLSGWICDFSLLHRLPPPKNADRQILKYEASLKEFYITMPGEDPEACVRSLVKYCSSYDYRASKFSTDENRPIFDEHIYGALIYAWKKFDGGKGFLHGFSVGDSTMSRNSFSGALCCSEQKYRIDIEYCSFSRMNELRYIIGDMIKYSENKIRAALGVKSRLMIYATNSELYKLLDEYFELMLPPRSKVKKKAPAPEAYDVLYETPKKEFSLEDAKKIESESWGTTNELVSAFEKEDLCDTVTKANEEEIPLGETEVKFGLALDNSYPVEPLEYSKEDTSLTNALGDLLGFALAVKRRDILAISQEAKRIGKMKETIIDEINDIAIETIGDILIEDNGDGYAISEFYSDLL